MVSSPDGRERTWTFRRSPEDKRGDAEAVMSVTVSSSGMEFEFKITAAPFDTEPSAGRRQDQYL